ncbi:MAG: GNAT family N-acetyltransferase [Phaeodactylibacter sp.]|nr:GNAT family N-acetyltransferase [Phaeodactylibacter sp.]MCB9296390.1 GNAT family N-acetyltransferase [Lewinellaceae bacterium]
MPANHAVHLLRPGDEALLIRLAEKFYNSRLLPAEAKTLLNRAGQFMLCVLEGDNLAGFCYFHILPRWYDGVDEIFVYDLEVKEEHHRKGYGRKMFRKVFAIAKGRDIPIIWLLAKGSNGSAIQFYEKMGGKIQTEEAVLIEFYPY